MTPVRPADRRLPGSHDTTTRAQEGLKPGRAVPIVQGNRPDLTDLRRVAKPLGTLSTTSRVTPTVQEGEYACNAMVSRR